MSSKFKIGQTVRVHSRRPNGSVYQLPGEWCVIGLYGIKPRAVYNRCSTDKFSRRIADARRLADSLKIPDVKASRISYKTGYHILNTSTGEIRIASVSSLSDE